MLWLTFDAHAHHTGTCTVSSMQKPRDATSTYLTHTKTAGAILESHRYLAVDAAVFARVRAVIGRVCGVRALASSPGVVVVGGVTRVASHAAGAAFRSLSVRRIVRRACESLGCDTTTAATQHVTRCHPILRQRLCHHLHANCRRTQEA